MVVQVYSVALLEVHQPGGATVFELTDQAFTRVQSVPASQLSAWQAMA
jgi:hypothetical protein